MRFTGPFQPAARTRRLVPGRSLAVWFALFCLVAVGLEVHLLFGRRVSEFRGRRPRSVEEFGAGAAIAQTFTMGSDGLRAVTLFVDRDGGGAASSVPVWCRLSVVEPGGDAPVASTVLRLETGSSQLTFRVPLQTRSGGKRYRIDVKALAPVPGGLGLQSFIDGEVYPGAVSIEGTEKWADLRMRLEAASRYSTFIASASHLRGWRAHRALHLLLLALGNWALIVFGYFLIVGDDQASLSSLRAAAANGQARVEVQGLPGRERRTRDPG